MKTLEQIRIEVKLKLWDTPGFFQFLEDLSRKLDGNCSIDINPVVEKLKVDYKVGLLELENLGNKFKQGKLPL